MSRSIRMILRSIRLKDGKISPLAFDPAFLQHVFEMACVFHWLNDSTAGGRCHDFILLPTSALRR
jgi:hypothetical protein